MSVYTAVTADELDAWLARYALGTLVDLSPIAAGIENTNYFVTTERGRYVLTLYERLPADELPFYLNLMAHLARAGVEVPAPAPDRTGALFSRLNGRPAGLVRRIDGAPVDHPTRDHCAWVGNALARLHVASQSYRPRLTNRRGPAWWRQAARAVRPFITPDQDELLAGEVKFQTGFGKGKLPKGAIHGDLFCDNVLFAGGRVAGIIDFGFGKTEIDDSGNAAAGKQDIVAEEIAVNRAFRQLALAEACLEFHFACEQLVLIGRNERTHCARGLAPPRGAAPVGEPRPVALRSDMKPCEGVSHPRAVIAGGMVDGRTVDPAHQPGRPAVQAREQSAGAIGRRRGHFDAGSREVRHQVQIERQFVGRQTLVQRQNVPATLRGHEIVRVLDARGDRRKVDERSQRVSREPR